MADKLDKATILGVFNNLRESAPVAKEPLAEANETGGYIVPAEFILRLSEPFHVVKTGWLRWGVCLNCIYAPGAYDLENPTTASERAWLKLFYPLARYWRKEMAERVADELNRVSRARFDFPKLGDG